MNTPPNGSHPVATPVNPSLLPDVAADPIERLRDQPAVRSSMDPTPKGPVEYELAHKPAVPTLRILHKSKFLHVLEDLRERNSPENRDFEQRLIPDIAERGIQVPLIGYTEGECVRLIDGETRLRALLLGPRDTAPVLVYDQKPSDGEIKLAGLLANSMRQGMSPLEQAKVYADLMKLLNVNQAELARRIHTSPAQIAKCLAISSKLCIEVQQMVAAGEIPPRAAYAISRLADVPMQIDLAKKVKQGLLCVEGAEAQVGKLLGSKKPKQKPMRITLAGIVLTLTGDVVECLRSLVARAGDALRRLDKEKLPPEVLPSLLKG